MPEAVHSALEARLEGRAEVLEVTRARYRALRSALSALFWRDRLRARPELLHQVAFAQPWVDQVVDAALHRLRAEDWPEQDPMTRLVLEVDRLRRALIGLAARRLGREGEGALGPLLDELDAELAAPRAVTAERRWATAVEVLPRSMPELLRATERCDVLEALFKRPLDFDGAFPFSPEQADALSQALPEAQAALDAVWARLDRVDPTGGLRAELEHRARRAPVREPADGAEALLRAAFWLGYARATLQQLVAPHVYPVPLEPAHLLDLARWIPRRDARSEERLDPGPTLSAPRAGLYELGYELRRLLRIAPTAPSRVMVGAHPVAPRAPLTAADWDLLADRARRADALGTATSATAGVRLLLTRLVRSRPHREDRSATPVPTLEALIRAAQASVPVRPRTAPS